MIFISYRRDDTKHMVALLSDRLRQRYGESSCFVAPHDIPLGAPWPETLKKEWRRRKILLVVIGKNWATARYASGENENRLRLEDKQDWVRQEICAGIKRRPEMRVVRVMVDGANLPATVWRCELDELHRLQSFELHDEQEFEGSFASMCEALEKAEPGLARMASGSDQKGNWQSKEQARPSGTTALQRYVEAERSKHLTLKLPLVSPSGRSVVLPMEELRIDLPLIVSHERMPTASSGHYFWLNRDVVSIHEEIRNTHTTALLVDRGHYDDIRRDCGIHERLAPGSRTVVVGDPGCGKTTLLEWISHSYASVYGTPSGGQSSSDAGVELPGRPWLPLLILCREWAKQPVPHHFADFLHGHFSHLQFSEPDIDDLMIHVERLLDYGEVILLVDGLDELPDAEMRRAFAVFLSSLAGRFPHSPMVVTSRVIGFQSVREEMTAAFDHLVVGPLDRSAKAAFLRKWGALIGWDEPKQKEAIEVACDKRRTAKLTDTILLLALVAQIQSEGVPERAVDIYRRTVELMMERRRYQEETPVGPNELLPHLEYLAFEMRKREVQRISDAEVVAVFEMLREKEPTESVLTTRHSKELLSLCINSLGLLNVAAIEVDARGYERSIVQFFHQSFQEYFASQAVKHGRGGGSDVGVVARLRNLLNSIEIKDREITLFGNRKFVEPMFADYWQETIRQCIADLQPSEANRAIEMLLPNPETPFREARSRTVFALQCLADEPRVSNQVVNRVFEAVIDNLDNVDANVAENRTLMDHSLGAIGKSVLAQGFRERLVEEFIRVGGHQRMRAGLAYAKTAPVEESQLNVDRIVSTLSDARKGMESRRVTTRVATALQLVELFFRHDGKLGRLALEHRSGFAESLLTGLAQDPSTIAASLWALSWLTGAKVRPRGDDSPEIREKLLAEFVVLEPGQISGVANLIRGDKVDLSFLHHASLLLTRQRGLMPVMMQNDWIYRLAMVADGALSRKMISSFTRFEDAGAFEWLIPLVTADYPEMCQSAIALTLGSFGVFCSEMGKPLWSAFQDSSQPEDYRDEALIYLAFVGDGYARKMIETAADTVPEDDGDYRYARGLFGLLLIDDVDLLAKQIQKALPHSDLDAYAYALAGTRHPRGMTLLAEFASHPNPKIVNAVRKALREDRLEASAG